MYPQRRKRNLGLPTDVQKSPELSYGIDDDDWGNERDIEEDVEELDVDDEVEIDEEDMEEELEDESKSEAYMLNGKPFFPKQKNRKKTFEEGHVRITTYLENDCHLIVRMLLKQGQIPSITFLINESVKAYLLNEFSEE